MHYVEGGEERSQSSPIVTSENSYLEDVHSFDSSEITTLIVGRNSGFECKHRNANFATKTNSVASSLPGAEWRWSITSLNSVTLNVEFDDGNADVDRDEMRSPGSFPIITSRVSTPKL